ncbi:MAG: RHO alpha subunit C-terminal catalytic domain-containing protein, partial [Pseudomonadota bacterium]
FDGSLRGLPAQSACFPDLDKSTIRLHDASVAVYRDLVFVHPASEPAETFESSLAELQTVPWPHSIAPGALTESSDELVYEVQCNWKVFIENALDGYHLAYLHKNTLGGPTHDKNCWEAFGRNLVWWSTERAGVKHRIPVFVERAEKGSMTKTAHEPDQLGYGGVYFFFPNTLVTPNPWGFSLSIVEPESANVSRIKVRNWAPRGWLSYTYRKSEVPGYDKASGLIKSACWDKPPLDYGDFQTEDIWVCEKMQRALQSPKHAVTALAAGSGGETAIAHFQRSLLDEVHCTEDQAR